MYRNIANIIHGPQVRMGQISLRQPLPTGTVQQISPFILLHHFDMHMEPGENKFDVPAHPHRGFMPVTFMFEGAVQHDDSLGNTAVIGSNEVQWISAARGIIHAEKVSSKFLEKGGRYQGVQLWINLPKAEKMSAPYYQPLTKDDIILTEQNGVQFRLVSGTYEGKTGPAKSAVLTAMMRMRKDSEFTLMLPADENVIVYVLEGVVRLNDTQVATQHDLVHFAQEGRPILLHANSDAALLMLSGKPIDEPLVTHGPYVMNSETEILEAMRDYQNGKMGFLY